MTDYPDHQTPAQHALEIFNQTVPLARKGVLLTSNSSLDLPPGITLIYDATIDQVAYELGFAAQLPSGQGTVPFIEVSFSWADVSGFFVTWTENYAFPVGNGSLLQCFMRGPLKGEQLTFGLKNLDPSIHMTVDYSFAKTSHPYEHDYVRQQLYPAVAPIGFTQADGHPTSNVPAHANPTITPGNTASLLCAVMVGRWKITLDNSAGTNAVGMTFTDPTATAILAGKPLYSHVVAAGQVWNDEWSAPACPPLLNLTNQGVSGNVSPVFTSTFVPF